MHWSWPRVLFESRASVSNGYLQHTGRSASPHRTVRCSPDSCAERVSNSRPHRTLGTGRSGAHRTCAQRGLQKPLTPDANHRTLPEYVRCSTLTELSFDSTPDSEASVRCLCTQRPVSVSQREKHSRDFSKFPTGAIENIHLFFFQKR